METEGDVDDNIRMLTRRLREKTIDVGVIGIGENAHIAFNDPPADFDTKQAYIIVIWIPAAKNSRWERAGSKTRTRCPVRRYL